MTIQILGSGCPNCRALEANAARALEELGVQGEVCKITDSDRIMEMGALVTPALAVDGELKSSGKVLSTEQIIDLLRACGAAP